MAFVGINQIYTIVTNELVNRVEDWSKLAASIDNALVSVKSSLSTSITALGPAWAPGSRNVPADADMNTYKVPGISKISTPDTAAITNLPPGMRSAGIVENLTTGDATDSYWSQRVTEYGANPRTWWRVSSDTVGNFNPWSLEGTQATKVTDWHVFLAVGQSNMSGRGIVTAVTGGRYVQPRIAQFGFTRRVLETATVPLDMHDSSSGLSPATVFAQAYLKSQPNNVGVLIVPAAHGATGFTSSASTNTWTVGAASAPQYDLPASAVAQTNDAINAAAATGAAVSLKGILWHQGENNSTLSTATYASRLDELIGYFRGQFGKPALPFLVGQMVPEGITANAGRSNIDLAHQQTPDRVPNTGFAPARTGGYNPGDTTHMSQDGVDYLGRNYVDAYERATGDDNSVRLANMEDAVDGIPAQVDTAAQTAVVDYIANDPSVVQAAADLAANNQNIVTMDAQGHVPVGKGAVGLPTDQLDYVAALVGKSKSTKLQLKKNGSTNEVEVSCLTPSGSHVTYQFYGSAAGDDYRVLANVWAGTSTATTAQTAFKYYGDLAVTGTFVGAAGAFAYTTDKTTPASWTVPVVVDVDGSDLRFHTYRDNRGGLWEVKVSGPAAATVNVSTWAASASYSYGTYTTLASNLRAGTYTVTGKFLGDDPLNVPSGGAGTARGWLANNAVPTTGTANSVLVDVYAPFRQVSKDILLKPASNMDIAMQVKPTGGTTLEWMPYHGVATMFQADAPVYLDGDTVVDVAAMQIGQYRVLSSFELVQRVYGRNSTTGTTNLVELATSHLIRASGHVSVTGRWVPLSSVTLGDNYHLMFPASMVLFDKLVTSMGNAYRNGSDLIGLETNLVAENDTAMSYMFLSSANKSIAGAVRFNNPQETLRRGKASKNPDATMTFLQHRDASIVKVYTRPRLPGTVVAAGTVNRFSGDYIYTQALGLFDQYAL